MSLISGLQLEGKTGNRLESYKKRIEREGSWKEVIEHHFWVHPFCPHRSRERREFSRGRSWGAEGPPTKNDLFCQSAGLLQEWKERSRREERRNENRRKRLRGVLNQVTNSIGFALGRQIRGGKL